MRHVVRIGNKLGDGGREPDGQCKNLLSKLLSMWQTSISLARHSESVLVHFRPIP